MTKREAAIVSAYTGILLGRFQDVHEYIEEIMGCPVFIHQLASVDMMAEIAKRARADFMNLEVV
jgi:hypothetical protein